MRRPSAPEASGQAVGDGFGHRVDHVRAHRVAAVDVHVHDQALDGQGAHLQVARPAAALHQTGQGRVGHGQDRRRGGFDGRVARAGSATSRSSIWAVMIGFVRHGHEAAALAHHARGIGGRRDHRRLLDGHGNQAIHAVDKEIETESERHGVDADGVLDHAIGTSGAIPPEVKQGEIVRRKPGLSGQLGLAFIERQTVETRQA
jgi:hypothetical protein